MQAASEPEIVKDFDIVYGVFFMSDSNGFVNGGIAGLGSILR